MDGRRFDELTRAIGSGTSRRRLLGGVVGAALGAVGLGHVRSGGAAAGGQGEGVVDVSGRLCAGFAGLGCPVGYRCVDDDGVDCVADAGGSLCLGRCVVADDPCAPIRCADGFFCCNECGGTCEPNPPAASCAAILCAEGTRCCELCGEGTCVPIGELCPVAFCAGEPCGGNVCGPEEYCCNPSCGICAPLGGACIQVACVG